MMGHDDWDLLLTAWGSIGKQRKNRAKTVRGTAKGKAAASKDKKK